MIWRYVTIGMLATAAPALAQAPAVVLSPANAIDPAKLAIATRIVARVLPVGSYRKMMSGVIDNMTASMIDRMTDMPIRSLAAMGGVPESKLKALGPTTLRQILAIVDPVFDQRVQITMKVTMDGIVNSLSTMEPVMRDGMAEAYANRFTMAQLADLDRFFATPTGSFYAEQAIQIASDPAIKARMQSMYTQLSQAMPGIMAKVAAATASLPKPRTAENLSTADKRKLAELLGNDPKDMKQ